MYECIDIQGSLFGLIKILFHFIYSEIKVYLKFGRYFPNNQVVLKTGFFSLSKATILGEGKPEFTPVLFRWKIDIVLLLE